MSKPRTYRVNVELSRFVDAATPFDLLEAALGSEPPWRIWHAGARLVDLPVGTEPEQLDAAVGEVWPGIVASGRWLVPIPADLARMLRWNRPHGVFVTYNGGSTNVLCRRRSGATLPNVPLVVLRDLPSLRGWVMLECSIDDHFDHFAPLFVMLDPNGGVEVAASVERAETLARRVLGENAELCLTSYR